MTSAVTLRRRSLPEQLRYLAGKLEDGQENAGPVMLALLVLADEIDAVNASA